ncbi:hypothetical protein Tco_0031107 [Tanacetum coccineum]
MLSLEYGMRSRRDNRVSTRGRNNSQQAEDVTEVGSNQPNNTQVPGNARKRVRGPTFMPKVWTKTEEDRISIQFNEYGTNLISPSQNECLRLSGKDSSSLGIRENLSEKNNANRAKKKMMQVTGKTSYAQVREKQKDKDTNEWDEHGPQDIYSKVMGNDKNGTAEIYNGSPAERLSIELAKYKAREAQRQGSSDNDSYGINVPRTSPQGHIVVNEPQPLRVGLQVYFKSISNSKIVDVQVAIKKDEYLVRKYGLFVTVQDAISAPVAWPCSLVLVVREDY